jgi:DNA-binding LacI/PurR family transcriptional regulator
MRKETENISVRTIAQRLGVSPATVSLALNGRRPTSFVSMETRRQVWVAAQEMGYPLERLRSNRPLVDRIAIFMLTGPNPVYSETALVLCRDLSRHRVQILTHLVRTDGEAAAIAQELRRKQEIDAAVFIGSRSEIVAIDVPSVFIGEVPEGAGVWQARADNYGGGRAVGEHLWSLGHRAIAALFPGRHQQAGERRLNGLRSFLKERGAQLPDERVHRIDMATATDEEVHDLLERFVAEERRKDDPATALFCFNDWVAGKVLKQLRRQGVRVPEDISVIGFDDRLYADFLDPPLTTVRNPFEQLGELAAALLLEQAEAPNAEPRCVVAPCDLVVRESCGPSPSRA